MGAAIRTCPFSWVKPAKSNCPSGRNGPSARRCIPASFFAKRTPWSPATSRCSRQPSAKAWSLAPAGMPLGFGLTSPRSTRTPGSGRATDARPPRFSMPLPTTPPRYSTGARNNRCAEKSSGRSATCRTIGRAPNSSALPSTRSRSTAATNFTCLKGCPSNGPSPAWSRNLTASPRRSAGTKAQFLARLTSTRRLPVMARLDDGTFLSRIGALTVRIIEAEVIVTLADGTRYCGRYRLATTLTDFRRYPAAALIRLYHERWEHEVAYLALRHTLLQGRVLRSEDPVGLEQEIWALLALYQAIRREMVLAAETVPGTDPDRASFTIALQPAIDTVTEADGVIPADGTGNGRIGRAVLAGLLPPRRPRVSVRKVKSPLSRWNKADPYRPAKSTPVTDMTITLSNPETTRQPATRRERCLDRKS